MRPSSGSLRAQVLRGGAWLLAGNAAHRVIGLVRAIILARLLLPGDFGIAAIGLLTIQWLEYFSQSGFNTALIRKSDDVRSYYDTCWTVAALRGVALCLLLMLAAPLAALFFKDPGATPLIRCVALVLFLRGVSSPAVVALRRDLNFRAEMLWRFSGALGGAVVAIGLAAVYRNAWALIVSAVAAQFIETACSYWVFPFRPRFRLEMGKARELLRFGRWIFWNNVVVFPGLFLDGMLVGRFFGTKTLGFYQMASQLAYQPVSQIGIYLGGLALPAFAKLETPQALRRGFLQMLTLLLAVILPVGSCVGAFALPIVKAVLGSRWEPVTPIVQLLVWAAIANAITEMVAQLILRQGYPGRVAFSNVLKTAVLVLSCYPLLRWLGAAGVAASVLLACLASLVAHLVIAARLLELNASHLLPVAKAGTMAAMPFLAVWLLARPATPALGFMCIVPTTAASLCLSALAFRPRLLTDLVRR